MVKANSTLILHVVLFRLETGSFTLLEKNVGGVFETGLVRSAFCESGVKVAKLRTITLTGDYWDD